MKTILEILGIVIILFLFLVAYFMCVLASRSDEDVKRETRTRKDNKRTR